MDSLDRFAAAKLAQLDARKLLRRLAETDRTAFPLVARGGRPLLSFSCNDYLGLSVRPEVKAAAIEATRRHGTGAGASRLVTGENPLYRTLEAGLAHLKRTEAACVFGSGYLANIGVLGVFAGPSDLILVDELAHSCLMAGAALSRAHTIRFRHNDADHVAALLDERRASHAHALIVTETVFSMDGDRAPLDRLAELAAAHDAWLLTDDAHGFGLSGGWDAPVPLRMGTLSKAIGSYGGYCCGSTSVVDLLKTRARSLVYSTGLPPAVLAASEEALRIIRSEPALTQAPLAKALLFTRRLGLPDAESAIVPLIVGEAEDALDLSERLAARGFLVAAIRPPTVPPGTARLRFTFSALHEDGDVLRLAQALDDLGVRRHMEDRCPALS